MTPLAPIAPITPVPRALAARRAAALAALQQARAWGGPGAVGLIGVAAALILIGAVLPALQADGLDLDRAIDSAESRATRLEAQAHNSTRVAAPVPAPAPAPQRFRTGFPSARERTRRLAAILTLASEHGLDARRADMRLQPQTELGLLRYGIVMPLTGAYPQCRAFVEAALAQDPALSLDHVQLQRASASATAVTVDLSWTLWMQAEAVPPGASSAASAATPTSSAHIAAAPAVPAAPAAPAIWPAAPTAADRTAWPAATALALAAWTAVPPPPAPPAPKVVAMVAPPPQAPAFPYTPIGRLDSGVPMLLLAGPLRSFGVKAADVIDAHWRVDAVTAQGLSLTWLPGNLKKTIAFVAP